MACGTSELLVSLPDPQLPLLGSAEVRGLHAGGQLVQAAGELLHLLDDAIQGPAGGSGHGGLWSPAGPRQAGRAWMARLPRMGGGAGDGIDLPVLQQLQPLQLLLVVLAHLQDGGPGGQRGGRLCMGGACLRVLHAPWASPPHLRALPGCLTFPGSSALSVLLPPCHVHSLGADSLLCSKGHSTGVPTTLSCLASLSRVKRPALPPSANSLTCFFLVLLSSRKVTRSTRQARPFPGPTSY